MASIDVVNDIAPRRQYVAAPGQEDFVYPFPIFEAADLVVDVDGATAALNTDYTVDGEGDDTGGTISFVAPMSGGEIVTIYRDIAIARDTDFQQNGPFRAAALNNEFDKTFLIMQELESKIGRAIRLPVTSEATDAQNELSPLGNWLGKFIAISSSGVPEPGVISDTALTQSLIASLLQPQTEAEDDALVVPANTLYSEGHAKRYGVMADGTTDDTVAVNTWLLFLAASGKQGILPVGTTMVSALTALTVNSKLCIRAEGSPENCILKVVNPAATIDPILLLTGTGDVDLSGFTIDQNYTTGAYPPGHTYADNDKASTWGGGTWMLDCRVTGKVLMQQMGWKDIFRGAMVRNAAELSFNRNHCRSMTGLSQTVIAHQDCSYVSYKDNHLVTRDWGNYSGITGASGLYGISSNNVQICHNRMLGYQLVNHGSVAGSGLYAERLVVADNIVDTPPADTAFYRWRNASVCNNVIRKSGDMGIALSDCSYFTCVGNSIDGTLIGGIATTNCRSGVIASNVIKDIAQVYSAFQSVAVRLGSNAGTFMSGIVTDYQGSGSQSKGLVVTGNSLYFENLPPVSDAGGPVRALVYGIIYDTTTNTASQNTGVVTGNYIYPDSVNLPAFRLSVPTHRFYLEPATRTGTPLFGETFTNGGNSFRMLADYGDGNLMFIDKLVGTVPASTVFTGGTSGATITSDNPLPQLTFLGCIAANNIDYAVTG